MAGIGSKDTMDLDSEQDLQASTTNVSLNLDENNPTEEKTNQGVTGITSYATFQLLWFSDHLYLICK